MPYRQEHLLHPPKVGRRSPGRWRGGKAAGLADCVDMRTPKGTERMREVRRSRVKSEYAYIYTHIYIMVRNKRGRKRTGGLVWRG